MRIIPRSSVMAMASMAKAPTAAVLAMRWTSCSWHDASRPVSRQRDQGDHVLELAVLIDGEETGGQR